MKKAILTILIAPLLAGCSGLSHAMIDTGAAAGGGYLGNTLSHGDPLITAASAAGGALLAEGGQALVSSSQRKSFKAGYEKGQSDAVKTWYHQLQDRQRLPQDP
jgi:hypothetical protein